MIAQGALLMVVGMGTVFAFLGLLVGLMNAAAAFFEATGDRWTSLDGGPPSDAVAPRAGGVDEEIAVVLAAVEAVRRGAGGSA